MGRSPRGRNEKVLWVARNRSPRTIETYTDSAQELAAFARRHGHADLTAR